MPKETNSGWMGGWMGGHMGEWMGQQDTADGVDPRVPLGTKIVHFVSSAAIIVRNSTEPRVVRSSRIARVVKR